MIDALLHHRLVKVTRLAWHWPGDPVDLRSGPARLHFGDGRALIVETRSDWTIQLTVTDSGGLDAYDYDFDGGRWIARDATTEPPFAAAGLPLTAWTATSDGVRLEFGGHLILFRTHGGEVRT